MQFSQKLKPLFFYVFLNLVFLPACISLHEWGHWFAAFCLGYRSGYVRFTLAGGMFFLNELLHSLLDGWLIGISGGVTVTLVFAILFFCLDWETDFVEKQVLKSYCISQFTYAWVEGLYGIGMVDADALFIISNVVYPICFYAYLIWTFIYIYFGE
ncbi:MAG: hypothetical protein NDF57_05145 [archaeon GBS-70-058]|nr:hypothetical protein [Candidatus Culexarchaeum nevadense]